MNTAKYFAIFLFLWMATASATITRVQSITATTGATNAASLTVTFSSAPDTSDGLYHYVVCWVASINGGYSITDSATRPMSPLSSSLPAFSPAPARLSPSILTPAPRPSRPSPLNIKAISHCASIGKKPMAPATLLPTPARRRPHPTPTSYWSRSLDIVSSRPLPPAPLLRSPILSSRSRPAVKAPPIIRPMATGRSMAWRNLLLPPGTRPRPPQ